MLTLRCHHSYTFGWGRRFCPGSHIARNSLFITIARLVWGLNFSAPLDPKTGQPIVPDVLNEEATWSEGFVAAPKIFPVAFKTRSEKHAEIIRRAYEDVQREWQVLGLEVDER